MTTREMITTAQALTLLGVSRTTFWRLINEYKIIRPIARLQYGKHRVFYDRADIERIKAQRNPYTALNQQ